MSIRELDVIRKARKESLEIITHRKDPSFTDIDPPKLTSGDFEDFDLDFQCAARRRVGLYGIMIDYLIRPNDVVNYDAVWN